MTEPSVAAVAKALETTQHDQADVSWPDTGWGRCTPWHLCGLCTAVALALDAFAREHAHWQCDLCHCCGEKRHDGGDPCVSCESTAREREAAVWEAAAKKIPTSWLDPLLSGTTAVLPGRGNWGCPDIEQLLRALENRLRARAVEARGKPINPDYQHEKAMGREP